MRVNPRAVVALVFLTLLVYTDSLGGGFVWDDEYLYLDNPHLKNETIRSAFVGGSPLAYLPGKLAYDVYRPVQVLAHAWLARLTGLQPFGIHLASVLMHALASVFAFLLLCHFTDARVAWIAAALFVVHPLHVEAVAWMSAVSEVLAGMLMLLSLYLLVRSASGSRLLLAGSLVAAALAFLTKETALALPLLAIVLVGWRSWPLFAVAGASLALRFAVRGTSSASLPSRSVAEHAGVIAAAALQYGKKLFWPWPLAPEYQLSHSAAAWMIFTAGCALLGWASYRSARVRLAVALVLIPLAPALVSSLVFPAFRQAQDRFAYLSVLGVTLLVAFAARTRAGIGLAGALLLLWGGLSLAAMRHWRDPEELWTHTLRVTPASKTAVLGLGRWYFDTERFAEAERVYEHGLRYRPRDPDILASQASIRKVLRK